MPRPPVDYVFECRTWEGNDQVAFNPDHVVAIRDLSTHPGSCEVICHGVRVRVRVRVRGTYDELLEQWRLCL